MQPFYIFILKNVAIQKIFNMCSFKTRLQNFVCVTIIDSYHICGRHNQDSKRKEMIKIY